MSNDISSQAKAAVRRNTEEAQGQGNSDVLEELFADDFLDHTPQPNMTPDKSGARGLDRVLREAFPDFHAVIYLADGSGRSGDDVQNGLMGHTKERFSDPPTGKEIHFETVDAMRVHNGRIKEHWGLRIFIP